MRQLMCAFLLTMVVGGAATGQPSRNPVAQASSQNRTCRLQGTVGVSISAFRKPGPDGKQHMHPLFDGDVGIEMECHLTQTWSIVVEIALGMNTSPAMQMPITVGVLRALHQYFSLGVGATVVLHPNLNPQFLGGMLAGPMVQIPVSSKVELAAIVGPAFELEGYHALPGVSLFISVAFRP
jgi:hypothetical protein